MKWKKRSNLIIASILSVAYTIVTLMNIIGPLHVDATGDMAEPGALAIVSFFYYLFSLAITWAVYFYLRSKPKILFFTLIILGMFIIVVENFLWAMMTY